MKQTTSRRATSKAHRTLSPAFNPYVLDEIGFTLSDIRRARSDGDSVAAR